MGAADLGSAVTAVLTAFAAVPQQGCEPDAEANLMIHLTIRDVVGAALLAREGPSVVPGRDGAHRAAYEGALGVLWMLHPNDPFERESRYLALLETELSSPPSGERGRLKASDVDYSLGEDIGVLRNRAGFPASD